MPRRLREKRKMSLEHDIEELSFDDRPHMRRKRPSWLRITLSVVALIAFLSVASGGLYAWHYHLRRIPVTVNTIDRQIRVDTTIATLLSENNNFNAKPGRLLDVAGEVLEETGGESIVVKINGNTVAPDTYDSERMPENAEITVESGGDKTEGHTVEYETVEHGTNINLNNGPLQELKQQGKDGKKEVWVGEKSQKRVDKGVVEEPQDLVVESRTPRPAGSKVIALTFDDGPSQYSGQILDILKSKGVKATFFDVGTSAAAYPNLEQRMLNEGHQVASHSNTHAYLPDLDANALCSELQEGFNNIKAASGVETTVMRAPYGSFGVDQWKQAAGIVSMNVLWDIDTLDWKMPGAQAIHDTVLNNAHNGAIVLMHDGGGDRSQDVQALPGIIDDLKKQGYTFVTIEQLASM